MVGGARITVRYATIPRLGLGFPAVPPQLVVKSSPDLEEAKPLLGEDLAEVPAELFVVLVEGRQDVLAVREVEPLAASGAQVEVLQGASPAREAGLLEVCAVPEVTEP